jgi:hypothetical protein
MNITDQMRDALAAFTGPVAKCDPGQPRGKSVKKPTRTAVWLEQHADDVPVRDPEAERRQRRIERAREKRIEKRNATIRKRTGVR